MENIDKVCLALLILALITALAVGILYPFIQTKIGLQGERGPVGPAGKSVATIVGSVIAQNTTNFTHTSDLISQYSNTIVFGAYGTLKNIVVGATLNYAIVESSIARPLQTVYGVCFFDNVPIPLTITTDGIIDIGPVVAATNYNFSVVYSL